MLYLLCISSFFPESLDDKHRDNMAKHMPGLHSPMVINRPLGRGPGGAADASSASSLPVSESEDDLNGKAAADQDMFFKRTVLHLIECDARCTFATLLSAAL